MKGKWTRRRVNTALAAIAVVAVGCGVAALWLLAIILGISIT